VINYPLPFFAIPVQTGISKNICWGNLNTILNECVCQRHIVARIYAPTDAPFSRTHTLRSFSCSRHCCRQRCRVTEQVARKRLGSGRYSWLVVWACGPFFIRSVLADVSGERMQQAPGLGLEFGKQPRKHNGTP
jgi:hypothetical protein